MNAGRKGKLINRNNVLSEEAKIFEGEDLKKAIKIFSKYGGNINMVK